MQSCNVSHYQVLRVVYLRFQVLEGAQDAKYALRPKLTLAVDCLNYVAMVIAYQRGFQDTLESSTVVQKRSPTIDKPLLIWRGATGSKRRYQILDVSNCGGNRKFIER